MDARVAPNSRAEIERAYRAARFKVLVHLIFVVVCCVAGLMLRRLFRMPPAMLGVVIIVALLVFAGDIMRFLRLRDQLRRLQSEQD